MGMQQVLLVALVTILVGIAIIVAINVFQSHVKKNHQDLIKTEITKIVGHAVAYKHTPTALGGGGGSFFGYMPAGSEDDNRTSREDTQNIKFNNDVASFFLEYFPPNDPIGIKVIASSKLYGNQHPHPQNAGNATITVCFDQSGSLLLINRGGCDAGKFSVRGNW